MPLNTKQKQYVIIGGVSLLAVAVWLYMRKGTAIVSDDFAYGPQNSDGSGIPEYLYYNVGDAGTPRVGGNITFGDINIGGGGGLNNFQPCKEPFVPMPPGNGGGFDTAIIIPPLPPPTSEPPPAITHVVLEPYDKYKCNIVDVKKDLDAIAGLIGVPVEKIFEENLYDGTSPHMGRQKQETWEEGQYALSTDQSKGWVSNFYDPYSHKITYGRKVRYTLAMACECKKGNTDFCGQFLNPDYFASVHGLE